MHPVYMESAQLGEDNLEQVLPESSCTSKLSPEHCRVLLQCCCNTGVCTGSAISVTANL